MKIHYGIINGVEIGVQEVFATLKHDDEIQFKVDGNPICIKKRIADNEIKVEFFDLTGLPIVSSSDDGDLIKSPFSSDV
jgi:hypothetical protein